MTTTLEALTTPERDDELGRWRWQAPDGWQQGRGAFGGLVLATMIRAMEAEVTDPDHTLRTLTATLCGPTEVGTSQIEVAALRQGSGTTTLEARLVQGAELRVHAVGLFGRRRVDDADWVDLTPPAMPPWRDQPVAPLQAPLAPVFTQHFEYRPTGPIPYAGGTERIASGWIRPRHPGQARDAAYLVAQIDAWWPAPFSVFSAPRPMATVSFTVELMSGFDGLDPQAPLFHDERSLAAASGYAVEARELWGSDGRLMAMNQQTFAIIR